jgi:photosystem II stability/assembly factor-like uncharacterized protein
MRRFVICLLIVVFCLACRPALAADGVDAKVFDHLQYRSIGPAVMGGRVADIVGASNDPNTVYVAAAGGGLWKTTNGGYTWTPIFERQGTMSIGALALEPGNSDVIWLGTGEANLRNSATPGNGVYKSPDGGKTWQHLGLEDTRQISRIVINPRDTNTIYVGAFGHEWGPNENRGVFMTTDGGKTWQKTLYIDQTHGVSDLAINPDSPNILYACMWHFVRHPWTFESGDDKGGVFKSVDGGRTWKKLTNGLPRIMGRIGVYVAPSKPTVVYVIAESNNGILFRSDDGGETFRQVSNQRDLVSRGFYYTQLAVDPTDSDRVYAVASNLYLSQDGGVTFQQISRSTHVDFHAFWISPKDPNILWQGSDGGVSISRDRGATWDFFNNIPIGQFYQVDAGNGPFYGLVGGLQDNGTWAGPSRTRGRGFGNEAWSNVGGGDGFHALISPDDPDQYITESQGGSVQHINLRTAESQTATPAPLERGNIQMTKYRFNWNTPIIASPHDKHIIYFGGNVVFKSTDFGKSWQQISPDLTTNDKEKMKGGGTVWFEQTGAENYCTVITIGESPARAGVIWAGTDDGNLQLTTDGGKNWTNLIKNVSGVPPAAPVSHVEPSRINADTAYVSFDAHMLDDLKPYIFKTTDAGKTWLKISGNLPDRAFVYTVREDPKNTKILYAGTDLGVFISYAGGESWIPLNMGNLPDVAVRDLMIHPQMNDLILATHGRAFWVFDDMTPIQQMTPEIASGDAYLFDMRPAYRHGTTTGQRWDGNKPFVAPNPPYGALITYYLKDRPSPRNPVKIEILENGKVVRTLQRVPALQGLNRINWDLRYDGPQMAPPLETGQAAAGGPGGFAAAGGRGGAPGGRGAAAGGRGGAQAAAGEAGAEGEPQAGPPGGGGFRGFGARGPQALPGTYTVRLTYNGKTYEKPVEVKLDPALNVSLADLKVQFDAVVKVADMQAAMSHATRALDGIKLQLTDLDKFYKDRGPDAPQAKEIAAMLAEQIKQVDAVRNQIARPGGQGGRGGMGGGPSSSTRPAPEPSKLSDKISALMMIGGPDARPTPAQMNALAEVQAEFDKQMPQVNTFLTTGVPKINEALKKFNLPLLAPVKPVSLKPAEAAATR